MSYSPYSLIRNFSLGVGCIVSDAQIQKGAEGFNLIDHAPAADQSVFRSSSHATPFLQGFRGNSKVIRRLLLVEHFLDYRVVHILTIVSCNNVAKFMKILYSHYNA